MKAKKGLLALVLGTGLLVLFLAMAGAFTEKVASESTPNRVASDVKTLTLEAVEQPQTRTFSGKLVARQNATLAARMTATVAEVLVDVGDRVDQGDVLLRLDNADLSAKVRQVQQALASAQSQLNTARSDYRRMETLLAKKLVPQSQFDEAENRLKTAQSDYRRALAAVDEAETQFGFSLVRAPFSGVITEKIINQGDTATPGAAMLSLYNPASIEAAVNMAESVLPFVAIGQSLTVELPTYNKTLTGMVRTMTPAADTSSRSYRVVVTLPNSDPNDSLLPGMFAKVTLSQKAEPVLYLPSNAHYQIGQLNYVKVLDAGEVSTRLVSLTKQGRVRKGLKAGEIVILNP
ncbi:efflux RND transporter periplasmic adaptor subunit [Salinivibrio sp. ES.052]|uniref:efflux RND transporter periplasmic adaptor subunit n=1 Tax=Salinivibrio sp. ES.052 TaxID=1882823 RepID=UPI00092B43BD|nr:efflux RND transporter periplasmic adaptor subunit [Salinivibrio sp. ES.052]SIO37921.1 RND family efflux transporter, MFP subunit [Salinivibrio sp. ES.052]